MSNTPSDEGEPAVDPGDTGDPASLKPLVGSDWTNTVSIAMARAVQRSSDELVVDGALATVGDYRKMAEEWEGQTITLIEMEPTAAHAAELAKWPGHTINLDLLGHEEYDLTTFLSVMASWGGARLRIGHSGPELFDRADLSVVRKVRRYEQLCFRECDVPAAFVDAVNDMGADD